MASPRKLAKTVQYHARRGYIRLLASLRSVRWLRRRLGLPPNEVFDAFCDDGRDGAKVNRLEAGQRFVRPLPIFAEGSEPARPFFAARAVEETAPAYVAEFEGGIAWGHPTGGVFTRERRFAPAFTHDPSGPEFHTVWTRLSLPRARPLPGRTLYLVTPEAADNYHHWLIDLLPRLGQVQRAGYKLTEFDQVIVNHSGRKYQFATLERLGITADKIITAHRHLFVQAERLVVPSLKPQNQALPAADVAFLRQALLDQVPAGPARRRIFLSRADASYRRLQNEAELHAMLQAHDFEIIVPSKLDVPAQARLFAESAVIAGPAGAAFANLVFAPAGARVIEIAPPQWLAAFHWMISARAGLQHNVVLGAGELMRGVPDVAARQADIVVPPERLAGALAGTAVSASA